jgi:hypothetical protein
MLITGKTAQLYDLMSLNRVEGEPCHKLSGYSYVVTRPSRRRLSSMTPLTVEVLRDGEWKVEKSCIVHHLIGVIDFSEEVEAVRVTGHHYKAYSFGETAEWRINSWNEKSESNAFGVAGRTVVAVPKWKATMFDVFTDPTHDRPTQVMVEFDYKNRRRYVGMGRVHYDGDVVELEGIGALAYATT